MNTDEDLIFWHSDNGWLCAPFNSGEGGEYSDAADQLELLELAAEDAGIDLNSVAYLWMTSELKLLTLQASVHRRYKAKVIDLRVGREWHPIGRVPGFETADEQALAADRVTPLAVVTTPSAGQCVVWLNNGGRKQWLDGRQAALEARAAAQAAGILARQADDRETARQSGDYFINPYTFVPLPSTIKRGKPRGHADLGPDGLSGSFTWRLTMQSPLLYPKDELPAGPQGAIRYPGSSLRGTLRNLHESLVGGCFRAIDPEYCPVHREPMGAGTQPHVLAVVREIDEVTGAVTKVELTADLVWIEQSVVHSVCPAHALHSGHLIHVDRTAAMRNTAAKRDEIDQMGSVTHGSDWVLHLSATFPDRDRRPYYVAAGRLTGTTRTIKTETWQEFKKVCAGSQDLIGVQQPPSTSAFPPGDAEWPGVDVIRFADTPGAQLVGHRRKIDGWLSVGDTVWIGPSNRLKMATIWRYPGEHPVKDRLHEDFQPCHDPKYLCPSCAVFGSVDQRVGGKGTSTSAEQSGYASHVRVDWATSTSTPSVRDIELPPLRSPKPSSGGFYLVSDKNSYPASKDPRHRPQAHWGSPGDAPVRQIRGRKYYWHGQADNGRQTARPHHDAKQRTAAVVADAGLVLEARVTFSNLDQEQLGWLLAAADPTTFFGISCLVHVGGGKPLGYGSAVPAVVDLQVWDAGQRYAGLESAEVDPATYIRLARESTPPQLDTVHLALKRVLSASGYVAPDRIWYPTTGNFNRRGTAETAEDFDKSFEWFAHHSGGRPGSKKKLPNGTEIKAKGDMVPLPDVMNPNPYILNWEPEA